MKLIGGEMREENWGTIEIAKILAELQSRGLYPGIGYDNNGWEAWVFLAEPIEGDVRNGPWVKTRASTITEALKLLIAEVVLGWTQMLDLNFLDEEKLQMLRFINELLTIITDNSIKMPLCRNHKWPSLMIEKADKLECPECGNMKDLTNSTG